MQQMETRIAFLGRMACLACFSLLWAAPPDPRIKALGIANGSSVEVKTATSKVTGVLEEVGNEGLRIRPSGGGSPVTVGFSEIKSLKRKGKPVGGLADPKLKAALGDLPEGEPVTLTLADNSQVSGRLTGQTPEGLELEVPGADGSFTKRSIPRAQIAGVKVPKTGQLPGMPKVQSPVMVKKSLSAIPIGSPVDLTLPGGKPLSGKLMGMSADGFSLQTLEGGSFVTKQLAFNQVAGVKRPGLGVKGLVPGLRPPGVQTPDALRRKALGIPMGSPMTVTMPDGTKSVGKLQGVSNDGIVLQSMQGGKLADRSLAFADIGSMKIGEPKTPQQRVLGMSKRTAITMVTAALTGFISGLIAR
jgi:small nuclear ribonucleoprotein (snRNP)-like protein